MTETGRAEEIRREEGLREELAGRKSAETYGVNYLIEAGAGAGKTYILTNRIINQLLTGKARPEELAAITFTEKATQQMVDEIDKRLLKQLDEAAAAHGEESAEAGRIRALIDSIDQMQISTIHSFCRTLLMTMPYASELGPEFEVADDPVPLADAFFEQQIRERPSLFRRVREKTRIGFDLLKENFRRICETRAEIMFTPLSDAEIEKKFWEMRTLAGNLYTRVREVGSEGHIKRGSKTVEALMPKIREVLRLKDGPKEDFVQAVLEACNPCGSLPSIDKEAVVRVLPGVIKDNKTIVEDCWNPIAERWGEILHSLSMELFCALIPEYRQYKRRQKVATQQDLLCCARDMLRSSAEARSYFHQKYRCIYVDEMQDTDPVQAQILFYLTTEETDFDPDDWRGCRPAPGSLFLVGDPKQAIYRFRGADITVYKTLETLFRNGVGRVERLHFNFRSSGEITDFSDEVFRERLTGGEYQADYNGMTAVAGAEARARILAYKAEKETDPDKVAAFIAEMVGCGTALGKERAVKDEDLPHGAAYRDFLVLTNTNARTEAYVRALSAYGIPCNMAGAKKYAEIPQLVRGNIALQHLADPEDETKLAAVLVNCYRIPFPILRAYRQRAGTLTAPADAVRSRLAAEGQGERFKELFAALEELREYRRQSKSLSALAAAENLWLKSRAVWQEESAAEQSREYPMVLQFLHELRSSGRGLSGLAEQAEELLQGSADRELLLTEEDNCVRVMNLHKAKGLESEIVILAFDSAFKTDADKHLRYEGNREQLYFCLSRENPFGGSTVIARPVGWDEGPGKEEHEFLKAQVDRLLYVAATRAKTCLIVCGGKKNTWEAIAEKCEEREEQDAAWIRALEALQKGSADDRKPDGAEQQILDVNPTELEQSLAEKAESLSGPRHRDISPSMLEMRDTDAAEAQIVCDGLPHGALWGTILHRLLELCVRGQEYTEERRKILAVQAVCETLSDPELPDDERQLLDPQRAYPTLDALRERLAEEAVRQTAFLEDREHPLRQMLEKGKSYTELPFEMNLKSGNPMRALCSTLTEEGDELPIEMRGVIDLAVRGEQAWLLVDYKTDAWRVGETEEAFAERLRRQYAPQLRIYREILRRMDPGAVEATCLCAVSFGGKMIKL